MVATEIRNHRPELAQAREAFSPTNFGFTKVGSGWKRNFGSESKLGEIIIAPIGRENPDVLRQISSLQRRIWGDRQDSGFISGPKLSTAEDAGGAVFAAYSAKGIQPNGEGLFGFLYGIGGENAYISEIMGIDPEARDVGLGWYLKIIQAHSSNLPEIQWTFDPERGANAVLNLEKLGAQFDKFYYDRYGVWDSQFNGTSELPTPRFGVKLDITSPKVHQRIKDVYAGQDQRLSLSDIASEADYPTVTKDNVVQLATAGVPQMKYVIPVDIESLPDDKRADTIKDSQFVYSTLLTTEFSFQNKAHPEFSKKWIRKGNYTVTRVVTGFDDQPKEDGTIEKVRKTYYVITRKKSSHKD